MGTNLRKALKLPERKTVTAAPKSAPQFGDKFRQQMDGLNQKMRVLAATGNHSDYQSLDDQRSKLYAAYQQTSSNIDSADPQKAEAAAQRVLSAVSSVDAKVSRQASNMQTARSEWLKQDDALDDARVQIADLEYEGHPSAAAYRKAADMIRKRANDGKFHESTIAFSQLKSKLDKTLSEHRDKEQSGGSKGKSDSSAWDAIREESKLLNKGSKGPAVERLQTLLNEAGIKIPVDGDFDDKTKSTVMKFQKSQGLKVDGIVGAKTWGKLKTPNDLPRERDLAELTSEDARAIALRSTIPLIELYSTSDLIELALDWDAELQGLRPGSELADVLARGLLKIYAIVDERLRNRFVQGETAQDRREFEHDGSPLAELAEDIPPFGNVDRWCTYLRESTPPPRRRPRGHRPTPDRPQPDPPSDTSDPQIPIEIDPEVTEEIGDSATLPSEGGLPGPISEVVPPNVSTAIQAVINLILEGTSSSLSPFLGPLMDAITVVDAFEGARRTQAAAAKAWGARLAFLALNDLLLTESPQHVSPARLAQLIRSDTSLARQWNSQLLSLTSVGAEALMMDSVIAMARAYNDAIYDHEARLYDECARRRLVPGQANLVQLRREVGLRLMDEIRDRIPATR